MTFARSPSAHLRGRTLGATLVLAAWVGSGAAGADEREPPPMPGPFAGHAHRDARARNASCAQCHVDIAREWRTSLHRRSYSNGAFQRALATEPLPFCRGCHAPEAPPEQEPAAWAADMGVGCVTCHGEAILATAARPGGAPHALARDGRFGTAAACASCHEFAFPGRAGKPLLMMQETIREHAESAAAGTPCAGCHMPRVSDAAGQGRTHASHAFAESRSDDVLRNALEVTATRDASSVHLVLRARGVGHAFPTGDLFRRIEVRASAVDHRGVAIAEVARYLQRHFGVARMPDGAWAKVERGDDRVHGETVVTLTLGEKASALPIRYHITYERIQHPQSADPREAVVHSAVVLAEGVLAARRPP